MAIAAEETETLNGAEWPRCGLDIFETFRSDQGRSFLLGSGSFAFSMMN